MSSPTAGFLGGLLGSARKWLSPEASHARLVDGYPISPPKSASALRDGLVLYKGRQLKDMPISRLRKALADFDVKPLDAALRSELVSRLASCIAETASKPSDANQETSFEPPTSPAPVVSERPSNKRKVPEEATPHSSEPTELTHASIDDGEFFCPRALVPMLLLRVILNAILIISSCSHCVLCVVLNLIRNHFMAMMNVNILPPTL